MATERQIYGPLELPSGKKIKFKEPVGADRVAINRALHLKNDNIEGGVMLFGCYLAAKCITEINGEPVQEDFKDLHAGFLEEDSLYYQAVFNELFWMTVEKEAQAKEAAKNLRSRLISTASQV